MRLETRLVRAYDRTPAWALWLGAGLLLLVVGGRGLQAFGRNWWDTRGARAELDAVKAEEARLEQRLKSLKGDDGHLERVARRELGLMKPGELEYRFDPAKK